MSDAETPTIVLKPQAFRGTLAPGTRLGAYELISVLGQGGFGITYLARDTQLGRLVAIKEYLPGSLALREADTVVVPRSEDMEEEFRTGRDRFIDEARTLAKLGSVPSIVPVYDFLEANGTAYMVMAFAEGDTLSRRLRDGRRFSPADVDGLLQPLMDGLTQVHAAGFVHRDIKPDNIILDDAGKPTLIDFGASRAPVAGRTGAMTAIFTPGYAAAEQFTSGKQGPWTDIYGLAATLHHAICGSPPPSAFDRMLGDDYVPLADRAPPGFAPALLHALDRGLGVRPGTRPQSIAEWRTLLGETTGQSAATIVTSPREAPKRSKRNTRALYATAAIATLLFVAGAGYFLATRSTERTTAPVAALAPTAPMKPAEVSAVYDGKWSVYTICGAFQSQAGFEHTYEMTVKDGAIAGEDGPKDRAGAGTLTGWIAANGNLSASYSGTASATWKFAADTAIGSPVSFTLAGHVYDGRGSARQNTFRPCSVTFIQLDEPGAAPSEPAKGKIGK